MNPEAILRVLEGQADLFRDMTTLERFTGLALVGLCARADSSSRSYKGLALEAVDQAQAVIAEIEKRTTQPTGAITWDKT